MRLRALRFADRLPAPVRKRPSPPSRRTLPWTRLLLAAALALPGLARATADPQVTSLVDSPDPVTAGGLVTYTVGVSNLDTDASAGTVLTVQIPSGAGFVSASPAAANCVGTVGGTSVQCTLGNIGGLGADVRTIQLIWRATIAGPATVDATATLSSANDSNTANNTQLQRTTVNSGANLSLAKTGSPDPVVGGALITYTLTPSNAGPNDSGDLVLTDNLPPSVAFVSASGTGWSCAASGQQVSCTRPGPHPVGPIAAVTITGTVNASGGSITNSATVLPDANGGIADPDTSDNTATASTVVTPGADIRIAQKRLQTPGPFVAGGNVGFIIEPRNGGPAAASNVVVSDTLPAGWGFVSAVGTNWSCGLNLQTVSCTRASMPASAVDDITIIATAPAAGNVAPGGSTYTNTATISASSNDPDNGNNAGSVNALVRLDGADLLIAKTKTPNPVALGADMTSSITVRNSGPRAATGPLRVVDKLSGETYVTFSGSGWNCTPNAGNDEVVCDHPNGGGLAVGASLPLLQIVTHAGSPGVLGNEACTGSSVPAGSAATARPPAEADPNTGNDCASVAATSTTIRPDLTIAKTTSTPTGGDSTVSITEDYVEYTLVVTNRNQGGANAATGIRVTDTVPAYIAGRTTITAPAPAGITAPGGVSFSCSLGGATVTCNQTAGSVAEGQTVTIPIRVARPMLDGSFTNTATVSNTAEGDPDTNNNAASSSVTIEPVADLEMTGKSVSPGSVRAGQNATYVLSFRNNGPSPSQNVRVTDSFGFAPGDPGLTVVSVSATKAVNPANPCTVRADDLINATTNNVFSCDIGTLANGETQSVTLVVRPNYQTGNPSSRSFSNTAVVASTSTAEPPTPGTTNNSKSASLGVIDARADLLINKVDVKDPVAYVAGSTFIDYRLRITNNGSSYATSVVVTERATPAAGRRLRFVCDTDAFGSSNCNTAAPLCGGWNTQSASGGAAVPTFSCTLPAGDAATGKPAGELAANRSKEIYLRFEVLDQPGPSGDIHTNTASVAAAEYDPLPTNNETTELTTVRQRIGIQTSKSATPGTVQLGQPFDWKVSVKNVGPGSSLQTDLSDTLPAGTAVTGPISWSKTQPAASGSCSYNSGTRLVSCALGQLDSGGQAVVTIPSRVDTYPAGGSQSNSATVDNSPAKTGGIDTPGNLNVGTGTLVVQRSSLAGTVFDDRDRSTGRGGIAQAGEPRVAGVTIRLTGIDTYGRAVDRTTTTDAAGAYLFNNLSPSDGAGYTLTQTQPTTFVNSPVDAPSSGADAPSAGGSYSRGGIASNSSWSGIVLPGNTAALRYDFPEMARRSVSGFVYVDLNASGVRDPASDPAISGATVRLLDAGSGAVLASTTTDAAGAYRFDNLDPNVAVLLEQPLPASPTGLLNGPVNPGLIGGSACAAGCTAQPNTPAAGTDRIAAIDLSSGGDATQFNFGEWASTSIAGAVYLDRNANGSRDATPTDGRLPGVTLTLRQGSGCGGAVVATQTSDAAGLYLFTSVSAGATYTVCETQPAGYAEGAVNPGTNGSSAAANQITISNLPAGGSTNNDFGERAGSIAGVVWLDANHDGQQQGGEAAIGGVTMTLSGQDSSGRDVLLTTTSDASGAWRFDDLPASGPAGYRVQQQAAQPVVGGITTLNGRTVAGTINAATSGSASGLATVPSAIAGIVLPAGAQSLNNRFAEILPSAIAGTVFLDIDRDGVQALPQDTGLAGVAIELRGTDDSGAAVSRSTTTDADGRYRFDGLRPGSYSVSEPTQPDGTSNGITRAGSAGGTATPITTLPSAISAIALSLPATNSTQNDFAETPASSRISGKVWFDLDNDGAVGASEAGIEGVSVQLTGTDNANQPVSRTLTTDARGEFSFSGLPPGVYTLSEPLQPPSTLNGKTIAGTRGGTPSTVMTTPSTITGITLGVAQHAAANLFGELPPAELGGRVYGDNNDNGRIDADETGLAGVTLVLSGVDDLGRTVRTELRSGADGRYSFPNLRPGSYAITEPTQPPDTLNGRTSAGALGGNASERGSTPSAITGIVVAAGARAFDDNVGEITHSPDLRVRKSHEPATLTIGHVAEIVVAVRNLGNAPTQGDYSVSDRLPAGLTLAAVPTAAGWHCSGEVGASFWSCRSSQVLAPGAAAASALRVKVQVGAAAAASLRNPVLVTGGGEIAVRAPTPADLDAFASHPQDLPVCAAEPSHDVCVDPMAVQRAASLSGTVWLDVGGASRALDGGDRRLPGWSVEVVDAASGTVAARSTSGADGRYRVEGLLPGTAYQLRFRDPDSGVVFGWPVNGESAPGSSGVGCAVEAARTGAASSCVGTGTQPQLSVVLAAGQELKQQSLPVDPSGVVYDSGLRTPVPGSVVTLAPQGACAGWNPATQLVGAGLGGYTINGSAVSMRVGSDGLYQFLFGPNAPARCSFTLAVTPPAGYRFASTAVAAQTQPLAPPGGPGSTYLVQPQPGPPSGPVGPATRYFLTLVSGSASPDILHNHIPVDADLPAAIGLRKVGDRRIATIGDSVRYTLTLSVPQGALPRQTTVVDRLPAGFTYIPGTASLDDRVIGDPQGGVGPTLQFQIGQLPASRQAVLHYRVRIGVGAQQGDGINTAQAHACGAPAGCTAPNGAPLAGARSTEPARFQVQVQGGVFATEACVLGKVFVDCNGNQLQDAEELGIPGVRLVISEGTNLISDSEGKYSVCGLAPRSHVMKVDAHTLPRGARMVSSSNRNLGDADSLWLDLKNGELHRADFIEGSCSNAVLDQVKARRAQGEVRAPQSERRDGPALRFDSKAHRLDSRGAPQQATDAAANAVPRPRTRGDAPHMAEDGGAAPRITEGGNDAPR